MKLSPWIFTDFTSVVGVFVSVICIYVAIIVFCRITGLRSFSKMSASDFAMTVAVGSLFASVVSQPSPPLILGLLTMALLFAGQFLVAALRKRIPGSTKLTDNDPVLLMSGTRFLEQNLSAAQVTRSDIAAKLREANVFNEEQIIAVVFETTGDVSVLHVDAECDSSVTPWIFADVSNGDEVQHLPKSAKVTTNFDKTNHE